MEQNALTEPAISARGGIFLIAWAGAVGFSIGLVVSTRTIRRRLRELEELHADTRTRVFALDTIDEAVGIVRDGAERGEGPLCRRCGRPQASALHADLAGAHHFVGDGVDDQVLSQEPDSDDSSGSETP
jgi:hypothetical protein